jgi:hypothetical protein
MAEDDLNAFTASPSLLVSSSFKYTSLPKVRESRHQPKYGFGHLLNRYRRALQKRPVLRNFLCLSSVPVNHHWPFVYSLNGRYGRQIGKRDRGVVSDSGLEVEAGGKARDNQ